MRKLDRRAIRALDGPELELYHLLKKSEIIGFVGIAELCAALAAPVIELVVFSCLDSIKGKEELRLDLSETYFFRSRKFKELVNLAALMHQIKPVLVTAILPDLEPSRTWGWSTPIDELTLTCQLMIEDHESQLPDNWRIMCWSELETDPNAYTEALTWVNRPDQRINVHQEATYLRRFPDILFAGGVEEAARCQIAAYAHEGKTLEHLLPNAILVQSENPPERKDRIYQPLRRQLLPIIHPFKNQ